MNAAGGPVDVRLRVETPGRPTLAVVGAGVIGRLDALLREVLPRARRRLYVLDEGVASSAVRARWGAHWAPDSEYAVTVPAGEACKSGIL